MTVLSPCTTNKQIYICMYVHFDTQLDIYKSVFFMDALVKQWDRRKNDYFEDPDKKITYSDAEHGISEDDAVQDLVCLRRYIPYRNNVSAQSRRRIAHIVHCIIKHDYPTLNRDQIHLLIIRTIELCAYANMERLCEVNFEKGSWAFAERLHWLKNILWDEFREFTNSKSLPVSTTTTSSSSSSGSNTRPVHLSSSTSIIAFENKAYRLTKASGHQWECDTVLLRSGTITAPGRHGHLWFVRRLPHSHRGESDCKTDKPCSTITEPSENGGGVEWTLFGLYTMAHIARCVLFDDGLKHSDCQERNTRFNNRMLNTGFEWYIPSMGILEYITMIMDDVNRQWRQRRRRHKKQQQQQKMGNYNNTVWHNDDEDNSKHPKCAGETHSDTVRIIQCIESWMLSPEPQSSCFKDLTPPALYRQILQRM